MENIIEIIKHAVLQVYDKLNAFLTFIREQQEANAESEGEAESESAGE